MISIGQLAGDVARWIEAHMISTLALIIALAGASVAWAAHRLAVRKHRLSIAPRVEAIPHRPKRPGYYGILVMNAGQGNALNVQIDLVGLRRGGQELVVQQRIRNLVPGDQEMVDESYGHSSECSEVWGTITCVDIEGRRHESSRKKGDEHWTHCCLGK